MPSFARLCTALFATLLAAFLLTTHAAQAATSVIELTDGNFDALIASGDEWFVEFYAPWCGYCSRFAPQYEAFARALDDVDPRIKVGKLSVDENGVTTTRFLISRLPTLYHIKGGEVREVVKSFDKDALLDLVREKKWEKIEPWAWWWSPMSWFGRFLGLAGTFSQVLRDTAAYLNQFMPMWCVALLGTAVVLGVLFLVAQVLPIPDGGEPVRPPPQHRVVAKNQAAAATAAAKKQRDAAAEEEEDNKPLGQSTAKANTPSSVARRRRRD
ncbi:hypothetical protein AMAG_07202 [Allomyces macrogynus ATCC 38327]|uniref:Thioredoxin domain-containing protein n=1 Tax=Allomyces macrogynus (strain ATCC 38327) TaxID=578462 RepID=A0A0L0SHJ6_ALLM3|nr:hypothetical protein AMAG_07202 [Allomyces macrogynus ATCC 38327]|eukprot:KNE61934.1 hypothetical protein AMAG_07202 [Allomyces macrogynus ATCC 38327]